MMYDTRTPDRKWNITYYDYAANMADSEAVTVRASDRETEKTRERDRQTDRHTERERETWREMP